jgi:hypothetical protein
VPTDGERLATVEAVLHEIRSDVGELRAELGHARTRLHNLEGIAGTFVSMQKSARREEDSQYRRLGRRIQLLTLVVGAAAIVAPIVLVLLTGK